MEKERKIDREKEQRGEVELILNKLLAEKGFAKTIEDIFEVLLAYLKGVEEILPIKELGKIYILKVSERCKGDQKLTARVLRIGRTTLWRRFKKWGDLSSFF